jgi:hypothetical protein
MSVFCDEETPDFIQQDCGVERSGIVAVALISTDVGTPSDANLTSNTYWNTLTGQSPALAHILLKTRGEYPRPAVTSEEGFGRESKQNTSADHTINWEVEGLLDNRDFFESANRKKWKMAFITAADLLYYVDEPVTLDGRINNPKDIKMSAFWQVESSWTSFDNPRIVDVSALTVFAE